MNAKDFAAVLFGLVMLFSWYFSIRLIRQSAGDGRKIASAPLTYLFTGIVTLTELILAASLLVSK